MRRAGTERCSGSSSKAKPATVRRPRNQGGRAQEGLSSSDIPGSLDRGMLQQEFLVHLEPEPGFLERPDVAIAVDLVRLRAQFIPELVRSRHVAFKVAAVVDRGEEVDRSGV